MSFEKILKYMGIFLLGTVSVFPQTLRVTGSWTLSIDETYLSGPGGDLLDTYESAPDQILMDIHGQKLESYQVTVQRSDVVWNSYFRVYVRRTSDGRGNGYISGGTEYVEAGTSPQEFFRGGKNRTNIAIQLQLTGVTVGAQYGTYMTEIVYTITLLN